MGRLDESLGPPEIAPRTVFFFSPYVLIGARFVFELLRMIFFTAGLPCEA